MKLYLASPLGFTEYGRDFLTTRLIPTITTLGIEVLDPWDLTPSPADSSSHNRAVASANVDAILSSDLLLAVLDGPDVDSGTAAEIGFAYASQKKIMGYRSDIRRAGENNAASINLQVEFFVRQSGGTIARTLKSLEAALQKEIAAGPH